MKFLPVNSQQGFNTDQLENEENVIKTHLLYVALYGHVGFSKSCFSQQLGPEFSVHVHITTIPNYLLCHCFLIPVSDLSIIHYVRSLCSLS